MIPLEDQYLVLALRLELSLQFGNLSEVLKSISLLLDLWGAECEPHECEESEAGVVHAGSETAPILPAKSLKAAPIVQQLMRVAAINKNHQLPQNDEEPVSFVCLFYYLFRFVTCPFPSYFNKMSPTITMACFFPFFRQTTECMRSGYFFLQNYWTGKWKRI